jgi:hypothetical protein
MCLSTIFIRRLLATSAVLIVIVGLFDGVSGQRTRKPKTKKPCVASFSQCPDQGCSKSGGFDSKLNERKNIRSASLTAAKYRALDSLAQMKMPSDYQIEGDRSPLVRSGEGDVITTVAWLISIHKGNPESCNCGFTEAVNMDNHMVLITDETLKHKKPAAWEATSFTAEFTPRVRQAAHPNFTRDIVQNLINTDPRKRLRVRITGLLMFDSEHEKPGRGLKRATNWEIHPVMKFEYCPSGKSCSETSDANWIDIDQ